MKSHLSWNLDELEHNVYLRTPAFGMPQRARKVKYPIRALRYWFMHHLMREEHRLQRRPLDVCEVGVGNGQMRLFAKGAASASAAVVQSWDAVDVKIEKSLQRACGYTSCIEKNVEDGDFALSRDYDVIIALHVLEHLYDPQAAFLKLAARLRRGGIIIGGSPVVPDWLVRRRERQIRKTAAPFGHVSAFSPMRMRAMAAAGEVLPELITGAFCIRSTGSFLEDSAAWIRFNLGFGALFPSWPGEIYWSFRATSRNVDGLWPRAA